jgi:hypothetical protein
VFFFVIHEFFLRFFVGPGAPMRIERCVGANSFFYLKNQRARDDRAFIFQIATCFDPREECARNGAPFCFLNRYKSSIIKTLS